MEFFALAQTVNRATSLFLRGARIKQSREVKAPTTPYMYNMYDFTFKVDNQTGIISHISPPGQAVQGMLDFQPYVSKRGKGFSTIYVRVLNEGELGLYMYRDSAGVLRINPTVRPLPRPHIRPEPDTYIVVNPVGRHGRIHFSHAVSGVSRITCPHG
jgi:hypothetical protein